ncbi:MAG: cupin [Rhodocyclaceae bacterium]|nr:cupin [Rhodocyclaceae bacterium]
MTPADNIFTGLPLAAETAERIESLLSQPGLRIERIVSTGQASPPDFWYDQADGEWVILLAGSAGFRFADEPEERRLAPGDFLDIAAHRRHRVAWTDPLVPTVWLAVFYAPAVSSCSNSESGNGRLNR